MKKHFIKEYKRYNIQNIIELVDFMNGLDHIKAVNIDSNINLPSEQFMDTRLRYVDNNLYTCESEKEYVMKDTHGHPVISYKVTGICEVSIYLSYSMFNYSQCHTILGNNTNGPYYYKRYPITKTDNNRISIGGSKWKRHYIDYENDCFYISRIIKPDEKIKYKANYPGIDICVFIEEVR